MNFNIHTNIRIRERDKIDKTRFTCKVHRIRRNGKRTGRPFYRYYFEDLSYYRIYWDNIPIDERPIHWTYTDYNIKEFASLKDFTHRMRINHTARDLMEL